MRLQKRSLSHLAQIIPIRKAKEALPTCQLKLKIACHGKSFKLTHAASDLHADGSRVEKYRPDTLDDVSGHQDILATINRFVDTNVCIATYGASSGLTDW